MKRFFFTHSKLLLVVSLSASLSLLSSHVSNAASTFDGHVTTTNNLQVGGIVCGTNVTLIDVKDKFYDKSFMKNPDNWVSPTDATNGIAAINEYELADGSADKTASLVVSQIRPGATPDPNDAPYLVRYFISDNAIPLTFGQWGMYATKASNATMFANITLAIDCNTMQPKLTWQNSGEYVTTSIQTRNNNPSWLETYLFESINVDVTYPENYEGVAVPGMAYVPPPVEDGVTSFDYRVSNLKVSMKNTTPDLRGDEECRWYVNTNPAEAYEEGDVLNDKIISRSCTEEPTYTFEAFGHYEISLGITYPNGLDGTSEQTTWDAYKTIKIDGSTYSGSAGIHGNNPDKDAPMTGVIATMFNALTVDTFGLQSIFLAPIQFVGTLPAKVNNCTGISFPLLGNTVNIPCLSSNYWNWSTPIMVMYQTLINGFAVYFIATKVMVRIKGLNDPHNDRIEVMQL